jgi:O-antigen ligase
VDRAVVRRVENGLIAGGLLAVGYGLYQLLVLGGFPSDPPVPGSTDGRFGNDLLGPNNQAVALILPLVVCLSRAVTESLRSKRSMYTVMSALLLLGVLMTGSRGGVLATGVALITLVSFVPRGKARLAAYGLAGLAVAATIFIATPFGLAERTVETTSSSGRTDIWKVGLAACPQYCAFGSGWGTFSQVYADTQATVPDARVLVGSGAYEPHNVWILVAIELGIPGLVLLAAGLFLTVREALRLPSGLRAPPLSALFATIFAAFFLSNLEFKFFWMALILVALSRNVTEAPDDGADVAAGAGADFRTVSIRP